MNKKPFKRDSGFSTIQLVITLAIMTIVTSFAVVGITRARNHVRLMNSARQFAAYVERARADAVRRHGDATVSVLDNNSYAVTMDWDGFGTTRTQNFDLESGVVFTTGVKSVSFNWRGRLSAGGEQSFGFFNGNSVNVHVTGSGDVTFEAEYFFDGWLPPVAMNNPNPGGVMPDPGASPGASPSVSPGASPSPSPGQSPSPSPPVNPSPVVSPIPSPSYWPGPSPVISPVVSPNPSPNPSPVICSMSVSPNPLSIVSNGSSLVSVNLNNFSGTTTITATSSSSGQIQVSPSSQSVTGTTAVGFIVTVKRAAGSVTFSASGCGSQTVNVTIQ